MIDFIIRNAPIISLLFFFSLFCFILIRLMGKKAKEKYQKHANIPLKEKEDEPIE